MPRSIDASTVRRSARVPAWWPSATGSPRRWAHRPLPSMMIATARGISAGELIARRSYGVARRPSLSARRGRPRGRVSRFCHLDCPGERCDGFLTCGTQGGGVEASALWALRSLDCPRDVSATGSAPGGARSGSDLHDLGFFALQHLVDLRRVVVRQFLDALLGAVLLVGAHVAVVDELLQVVHAIAP